MRERDLLLQLSADQEGVSSFVPAHVTSSIGTSFVTLRTVGMPTAHIEECSALCASVYL